MIQDYFEEQADRFGLRSSAVQTQYILNWGGFVSHSFQVSDGHKHYHLKLVDDPEQLIDLRQWQALHEILEVRYRAPQMLDWVALPDTNFEGPLFAWIAGHPPQLSKSAGLIVEVIMMMAQLHTDRELATKLAPNQDNIKCRDTFVFTYIERFDEDLAVIASERPPFVSDKVMAWMMTETRRLEELAQMSPAFAVVTQSPIHGDLQVNNLLATKAGTWFLIDWDDLTIGDPALDYSTLLSPSLSHWKRDFWRTYPLPQLEDATFDGRMDLYTQARLLDWVIDVLADYVEADVAPEHRDSVRSEKKRQHLQALQLYRAHYD